MGEKIMGTTNIFDLYTGNVLDYKINNLRIKRIERELKAKSIRFRFNNGNYEIRRLGKGWESISYLKIQKLIGEKEWTQKIIF